MSNKSGTSSQAITLPTGGGALSGIGETFTPDPFTGTGRFSVPITVPVGRNGFQPALNLSYSSGTGNGPFGLGWELSTPQVCRKTSHGVPRYRDDAGDEDGRDTFILSGSEDLVHVGDAQSGVARYAPRTEGLFAHIDRIRTEASDTWRVSTKDGLVSVYGGGQRPAVVADPSDRDRVFCWKLSATTDTFGNQIDYQYLHDTGSDGPRRWDQLYLDRVRYVDFDVGGETAFLVSVTFVYDERPDPISEFRAGFEVRTRLRCRRIDVRTHADEDVLTRSYELDYLDDLVGRGERPASDLPMNGVSLLSRIRVVGHDGALTQELPPLDFGYTRFSPELQRFQPLEAAGTGLPPMSLADGDIETVDLFGNGLPDIVQLNGATQFWRNLGAGRFDRPRELSGVPVGVSLRDPGVQFADMNGDGRADLLTLAQRGYFPLAFGGQGSAARFVEYPTAPEVSFGSDDIRLVDLDGDGVVDALRTGAAFELFFNDPQAGWSRVETRPRRPLAEFPDITFSDPRVKLAELNGDGLQDIVLVDQRRVDYWPYHGHGTWGRRVTMAGSPVFRDEPPLPSAGFDPNRVLLGDIDGDGLDDIIYIQAGRITCWINRGGDSWSEPFHIDRTPLFTDIDGVRLTDMLGSGMAGVMWSTDPLPGTGSHYQFLDLTGGLKPYLLDLVDNNMGAVTNLGYAPSTRFYLADEASSATRWKAPLPFPVHVVERVDTIDQISGGTLTNHWRYHHGYWDGVEREFRGFGTVEQLDSEVPAEPDAGRSPPLLTRTWFHQGPVGDESDDFTEPDPSAAFWPDDPPALGHVASVNAFLRSLPRSARRDALRSFRGRALRTELYAVDGSDREERPFTVTEHAFGLREESAGDGDRPRIFFPHQVTERVTQWDRGTDPMTSFSFTDGHDRYGHPGRVIELFVPRDRDFRRPATAAEPFLGTVTTTRYAQRDDELLIVDRVAAVTTYEIRDDGRSTVFELRDAVHAGIAELAAVGQTLTHYDGEPFVGLDVGQLGDAGAAVRVETLVLTADLVGDDVPPYLDPDGEPRWNDEYPDEFRSLLPPLAGYAFSPGDDDRERGYFAQTERRQVDGRGLVVVTRDPLGRHSTVEYDPFGLLQVRSIDPAALTTEGTYDYRTLKPLLVTDVNGNRIGYAYSPLGLSERIAVMGKDGQAVGDTLDAPGTRFVYDLAGDGRPVSVRTIRRVHHVNAADAPAGERDHTIETVEYSDGFGRLIQTRSRAEDVVFGDATFGAGTLPADQNDPATTSPVTGRRNDDANRPNVVVSGWQIYDNKGRVVGRYEPFFATGWGYAPPTDAELGQRITMSYDPRGRLVRTVDPDGAEQRVVHGTPTALTEPDSFTPTPWEIFTYDEHDNAGRTHPEAARAYDHHWDTPSSAEVDAMGRTIVTIHRNRPQADGEPAAAEEIGTTMRYDIRGNCVGITDALGRQAFRYTYDLADRAIHTESLDGGWQRCVYDAAGEELERRDAKGALVLHAYDVLGRTSRLWARDNSDGELTLRERVEFGDGGDPDQPTSEREAARAANLLGAVHRQHDEAGVLTIAAADFKGNVLDRVRHVVTDQAVDDEPGPDRPLDPIGYETSITYDGLDRVTRLLTPAGTEGERRELRYGYDRSGNIERILLDGTSVVDRIAYDAKGQRTLIALGNGIMTRYAYDAHTARLVRLRSERYTRPAPEALTYRPNGAPLQELAYRHDLVGNVVEIVDRTPGCGVAANPEAPSIEDPALRALVIRGDALVRRFGYDAVYRLVSASGRECQVTRVTPPWSDSPGCGFNGGNHGTPDQDNAPDLTSLYREDFAYDPVGNLLQLTHTGSIRTVRRYEPTVGGNRLATLHAGQTEVRYRHDETGNVVQEATSRHFGWHHSDRLKAFRIQAAAEEPSIYVRYLYDAAGTRVRKLVRKQSGQFAVTTYIDGVFEHHRWTAADGTEVGNTHVHVLDGHRRLHIAREGTPHPDDHGPATQYMLTDHLGSSVVVVDEVGSFINREEHTPYGETAFGGFARKRYRFNGKERDEESGLNYHGARYYAPWLGRWISADPNHPDPTGTTSLTMYAGFANNPINLTDPDGRDPLAAERTLGGAIADIGQLSRSGEAAAQALTDFQSDFAAVEARGKEASALVYRERGPGGSGVVPGKTLKAADRDVKAYVDAQRQLRDLREEVRESGRRLRGAQAFLQQKGTKLLGKVSESRRASYEQQLRQAGTGLEQAITKVEGALGQQVERPIRYKPPKPPSGTGGGLPPARARFPGKSTLSAVGRMATGVVVGVLTNKIATAVAVPSDVSQRERDETAALLSALPPGADIALAGTGRLYLEIFWRPFLEMVHLPPTNSEQMTPAERAEEDRFLQHYWSGDM